MRAARMRSDRIGKAAEPFIARQSVEDRSSSRSDQCVGQVFYWLDSREFLREQGCLIVTSPQQTERMRGHGNGEHAGRNDRCAGAGHPPRSRPHQFQPIAMLQSQDEPTRVVAIKQGRPSPPPRPRDSNAIVADRVLRRLVSNQWHSAHIADRTPDERCLRPARPAQFSCLGHKFAAADALVRVEDLEHLLHLQAHRPMCLFMITSSELTDRAALANHRTRARRSGEPAMFLHDFAAAEIEERLAVVNRSFTDSVVVTGFPEIWSERAPAIRVVADDEVLDLDAESCDLVIHMLALHWASDPVGQLVQARRALRPDGLFLGVTFGGRTLSELREALSEAEILVTGGLSPRVVPMAEIRDLGHLLQRAGFALPVADNVEQTVTYPTPLELLKDLRAMGETNALAARHRRVPSRALFSEAVRIYSDRFSTPDGRVRATFDIVFLTGWAPSDTQPKPLRPGSATTRLADALDTVEMAPEGRIDLPDD